MERRMNDMRLRALPATVVFLAMLVVGGCSVQASQHPIDRNSPGNEAEASDPNATALNSDPYEGYNRTIYKFNYTLDGLIIRPVTQIYRGVIPQQGRNGVSNFLHNLSSPVMMVDSAVQGDPKNTFTHMWRFILNSTLGVAGVFDFASAVGLEGRDTDFGQTLAVYDIDSGHFLMLPLIGPSTTRDMSGRVVDAFADPFNYVGSWGWSLARGGATVIDKRSENMKVLDDTYQNSLDPYATLRSLYLQKRSSDIRKTVRAVKESRHQ
jgi:phospholipid-binding lipoprotein MlaA